MFLVFTNMNINGPDVFTYDAKEIALMFQSSSSVSNLVVGTHVKLIDYLWKSK